MPISVGRRRVRRGVIVSGLAAILLVPAAPALAHFSAMVRHHGYGAAEGCPGGGGSRVPSTSIGSVSSPRASTPS